MKIQISEAHNFSLPLYSIPVLYVLRLLNFLRAAWKPMLRGPGSFLLLIIMLSAASPFAGSVIAASARGVCTTCRGDVEPGDQISQAAYCDYPAQWLRGAAQNLHVGYMIEPADFTDASRTPLVERINPATVRLGDSSSLGGI